MPGIATAAARQRVSTLHMGLAPKGHLWVQLRDEGVVVEALADVALHMAGAALRYAPQALEQRRGAGRHKAWHDNGMHKLCLETPASSDALKALGLALY